MGEFEHVHIHASSIETPMSTDTIRCAVTGANGFIGRHLCRRLRESHVEVHALAKTEPAEKFFSAWHRCDVADLRQVSDAMRACRPQVLYHLAAIVSGSRAHGFGHADPDDQPRWYRECPSDGGGTELPSSRVSRLIRTEGEDKKFTRRRSACCNCRSTTCTSGFATLEIASGKSDTNSGKQHEQHRSALPVVAFGQAVQCRPSK